MIKVTQDGKRVIEVSEKAFDVIYKRNGFKVYEEKKVQKKQESKEEKKGE